MVVTYVPAGGLGRGFGSGALEAMMMTGVLVIHGVHDRPSPQRARPMSTNIIRIGPFADSVRRHFVGVDANEVSPLVLVVLAHQRGSMVKNADGTFVAQR